MFVKNEKSDLEDREKFGDGLIADQAESETTAVMVSPHQYMVDLSDHEPINQFFEWPIIRADGAYQPMQLKTVGQLLSNGTDPDNIQAASLVHIAMLSARLGYPIAAMLVRKTSKERSKFWIIVINWLPKMQPSNSGRSSPITSILKAAGCLTANAS